MIQSDKESKVLIKLALPMMFGILGMSIFNLVDTYMVGKLGSVELAALSFTFPVVMIVGSIAHGIGLGTTAIVAKAVAAENKEQLTEIVSWALVLALGTSATVALLGLVSMDLVFPALGAEGDVFSAVKEYMGIWYIGSIFVVVPMVGNSAIRGMGDTKTPSMVMLVAAGINILFDPLLIFGIGPFPKLGVAGAALATLISRFTTLLFAFWVLIKREKVIAVHQSSWSSVVNIWKEILFIGIPNALTKLILPLGTAIITGMVAVYGHEAVAGFGVAGRLEMFSLIPLMALSSILPIFIGQNLGAGKKDRVTKALGLSALFSLAYGLAIWLLFLFTGSRFGALFNQDSKVIAVTALYLCIVPAAYCFRSMMDISTVSLSVSGKPIHSALISLSQMFLIYIPLALLGSQLFGLVGIFSALAFSLFTVGIVSFFLTKRFIQQKVLCGAAM